MLRYNICVAEGIRYIIGQYGEGITCGEIKKYALTPTTVRGAARKCTPVFDFDRTEVFRQIVIIQEIQQGLKWQDIQSLVADRLKVPDPPSGRTKKWENDDERNGSEQWKTQAQRTNHNGLDVTRAAYPTGPALGAMEKKTEYAHRPLGRHGVVLCYGCSAHCGAARKANCT